MSEQETFCLIEKIGGNVVASFNSEKEARIYVAENIEPQDEWALVAFGKEPTDNRLLYTWGPV